MAVLVYVDDVYYFCVCKHIIFDLRPDKNLKEFSARASAKHAQIIGICNMPNYPLIANSIVTSDDK